MESRIIKEGEPFEPYDYSFLVLGASGSGKSAFINSLFNYLMGNTLENLTPIIPFTFYPNVENRFLDESQTDRNDAVTGKSQTLFPHAYKIKSPNFSNKTFLIVDTPGLDSEGGIHEDDLHLNDILKIARTIKQFNAILIIEKATTNRLVGHVKYNFYRISETIPNDFENKVIMVLAHHAGGKVGFQDEWFPFPIQKQIVINNEVFNRNPLKYKDESKRKKYEEPWRKLCQKFKDLITKIQDMNSQSTKQFSEIFNYQNNIMIQIADVKANLGIIEKVKLRQRDPTFNDTITNWRDTKSHNTICTEHYTPCHLNCSLNLKNTAGTAYFNNCACMNEQNICKVCGCFSEQHVHMLKEPIISNLSDVSLNSLNNNITKNSNKTEILKALEQSENDLIMRLCDAEREVLKISPRYHLSHYFELAIEHMEKQKQNKSENKISSEIQMIDDHIRVYRETRTKMEIMKNRK